MWKSLKDGQTTSKQINRTSFYIHLATMIIYTMARCAETVAFIKAAWGDTLPKTLFIVSNIIVSIAATLCYLLIIHMCWKMFKDYEIMIEIRKRKQDAKHEII